MWIHGFHGTIFYLNEPKQLEMLSGRLAAIPFLMSKQSMHAAPLGVARACLAPYQTAKYESLNNRLKFLKNGKVKNVGYLTGDAKGSGSIPAAAVDLLVDMFLFMLVDQSKDYS